MKQKKSSVLEKVSPDLLVSPHVVGTLFHVFTDEWQPEALYREELVTHLVECSPCRVFLIVMLEARRKYEELNGNAESLLDDLFTQFVNIHHEIDSHEYEQMGAYAETMIAKGRKEADKQFSLLAEHVKSCSQCKITLKETLEFLQESDV